MGGRLLSIHNIRFLERLAADIRRAIMEDRYDEFRKQFIAQYEGWRQKKIGKNRAFAENILLFARFYYIKSV